MKIKLIKIFVVWSKAVELPRGINADHPREINKFLIKKTCLKDLWLNWIEYKIPRLREKQIAIIVVEFNISKLKNEIRVKRALAIPIDKNDFGSNWEIFFDSTISLNRYTTKRISNVIEDFNKIVEVD